MYKEKKTGNNDTEQKIRNTYPPLKKGKSPGTVNTVPGIFLLSHHNASSISKALSQPRRALTQRQCCCLTPPLRSRSPPADYR
jgi:hypothetical protein